MAYWGGYPAAYPDYYPTVAPMTGYSGYSDQAYDYTGYDYGAYDYSYGGGYGGGRRSAGYDYDYAPRRDNSYGDYGPGYDYDDGYQNQRYTDRAPQYDDRRKPSRSALKESDLRRLDSAHGDTHSRKGKKRHQKQYEDDGDTATAGTASTVSTVGSSWREIDGKTGKDRKYKSSGDRSNVRAPTGKRMGLLVGVETQDGAVYHSLTAVKKFLLQENKNYKVETVIDDDNNIDQFHCDVTAGINELVALAKPGDSIFLYFANYQEEGNLTLGHLLFQLAQDVGRGVRITCLFDSCYLPARPTFRIAHAQPRIATYQSAGLVKKKRVAEFIPGSCEKMLKPKADIFCFIGDSAREDIATYTLSKARHNVAVFTAAFIHAFVDEDIRGVGKPPTYAALDRHIETKMKDIITNPVQQNVRYEVTCTRRYNIDQPCYI